VKDQDDLSVDRDNIESFLLINDSKQDPYEDSSKNRVFFGYHARFVDDKSYPKRQSCPLLFISDRKIWIHKTKSLDGDSSVQDCGSGKPPSVDAHTSSQSDPLEDIDRSPCGFHHDKSSINQHHNDLDQRQDVGKEGAKGEDLKPEDVQEYIYGEVVPDILEH